MKRTGFVSIIVLLIICLISIFCISITFNNNLQLALAFSSKKGMQLKILGEDKINRLIYDKHYTMKYIFPSLRRECQDGFKPKSYKIVLDDEVFGETNKDIVNISFEDKDNRKYLTIQTVTNYKDISNTTIFNGPVINHIFESGQAYIEDSYLEESDIETLDKLMELIKKDIKDYNVNFSSNLMRIYADSRIISVILSDNNEVIIDYNNIKLHTKNNLLVLENKFSKDTGLVIGSTSKKNDVIDLSGVLYVEGDLVINQPINFKGIMIINGGDIVINTDITSTIMGMIIHRGEIVNMDKLDLIYHKDNIYYYGIHLPGFMNPQLGVIKKY